MNLENGGENLKFRFVYGDRVESFTKRGNMRGIRRSEVGQHAEWKEMGSSSLLVMHHIPWNFSLSNVLCFTNFSGVMADFRLNFSAENLNIFKLIYTLIRVRTG